jgi:hypothetical protein
MLHFSSLYFINNFNQLSTYTMAGVGDVSDGLLLETNNKIFIIPLIPA